MHMYKETLDFVLIDLHYSGLSLDFDHSPFSYILWGEFLVWKVIAMVDVSDCLALYRWMLSKIHDMSCEILMRTVVDKTVFHE